MKVWLFQCSPAHYDLANKLSSFKVGDRAKWTVRRYREEMRPKDIAVLWQSGPNAGIYAVGELRGKPFEKTYTQKTAPPWSNIGKARSVTEWEVFYNYIHILQEPILRANLKKHPRLQKMQIFKFAQGTNFKVTTQEWKVLKDMISSSQPLSVPEDQGATNTLPNRKPLTLKKFDPKKIADKRKKILALIVERQGGKDFRQNLLSLYRRCVVTGSDAEPALEAAHIIPYQGEDTDHPANGLLLRGDIHTLFDLHLLSIDTATMTVVLAPELTKTNYQELSGRPLLMEKTRADFPSREALNMHFEEFKKKHGIKG